MQRRRFLSSAGLALTGLVSSIGNQKLNAATNNQKPADEVKAFKINPADWKQLRTLFPLTHDYIHLATFLLASHPKPVTALINMHRDAFDKNPSDYWHQHYQTIDTQISQSAANYMGVNWQNIALTDSTTMGLALVYSGIKLKPNQEILQTTHEHYSSDLSIKLRADRTGAKVRKVSLYDNPAKANQKEILKRLRAAITQQTKVVAVTWVHSMSGVKLPIHDIAKMIKTLNLRRTKENKLLFCVDGVHGFGIEDVDISSIDCDFFVAGTHKWIFGPRGTGVVWGSDRGWDNCNAVIPSFSPSYSVWLGQVKQENVPIGQHMSPGGFHSFEYRWALPAAFDLHMQLGKSNVQNRIHQLNTQTKLGLAKMKHVILHTPIASELSSGQVCFDVKGLTPDQVVEKLHQRGVIMSSTPYPKSYARFAPSLINNEQEIETALAEIAKLA